MGSRTTRYQRTQGRIPRGVCDKELAIDVRTGSKVLLKSGRGPEYGDTKWEYRAARLAVACKVPTVVGSWTRTDIVDGYDVRPAYVLPWLDGAVAVEGHRDWSRQQQLDYLRGLALAYIIGEGDRHAGNFMLYGGRMLTIDMAYPGYITRTDIRDTARIANISLKDVTQPDILRIVADFREARPAIEAYVAKMEHDANRMPWVPHIRGWKYKLHTLKRELTNYVRDNR